MGTMRLLLGLLIILPLATPAIAAKYEEIEVSDGGTIQGKVIYNGPVKQKTVLPTKDKQVCGGVRKEPLIVVGDGGAVQDSVVYLKDVASGKAWPEMRTPVVDQENCKFRPHVQVARQGKIDIVAPAQRNVAMDGS